MEKLYVIKSKKRNLNIKKQQGISLFESLLALTLLGSALTMFYTNNAKVDIQKQADDYNKQTLYNANQWAYYLTLKNKSLSQNNLLTKDKVEYTNYNQLQYDLANQINSGGNKYLIRSFNGFTGGKFKQTPCFLVYYNENNDGNSEINAIMYYVQDPKTKFQNQKDIALIGASRTPEFTGIYSNDMKNSGSIDSNGLSSVSGWKPNPTLLGLMKSNSCVAGQSLSNNSIYVNMQMLPLFNDKQFAVSGVKKTADQSIVSFTDANGAQGVYNSQYLAGHLYNNNTLKSSLNLKNNILFAQDTTANSGTTNKVGLNISYTTNNQSTINFGGSTNNNNTGVVASNLQVTESAVAGDVCDKNEIGKIKLQSAFSLQNKQQAQDLIVCSYNKGACPGTGYCYVPMKERKYTFTADANSGLEDANGYFRCPSYAPYLDGYKSTPVPNVSVFMNHAANGQSYSITSGSSFEISGQSVFHYRCVGSGWQCISDPCGNQDVYKQFSATTRVGDNNAFTFATSGILLNNIALSGGYGYVNSKSCNNATNTTLLNLDGGSRATSAEISNYNFANINWGNMIYTSNSGAFSPIYGQNTYTKTPVGVQKGFNGDCSEVCSALNDNSIYGMFDVYSQWQVLNNNTKNYIFKGNVKPNVNLPSNVCGCIRVGGDDDVKLSDASGNPIYVNNPYVLGIAAIKTDEGPSKSHLIEATCSTKTTYQVNF